ncbi:hypothetical protein BD770DRAFT_394911 [Pilaira anomala]|nr:hypothetical protein BD770DRAFT_394911 [Pilaira anomala]
MSDKSQEILRDRYLHLWLQVVKTQPDSTIHLHSNTVVKGKLCATDSENNRFRVDRLESPLGVYEKAVIRGTDINWIEWFLS